MNITFRKWLVYTIHQNLRVLLVALCGFCVVIPLCRISMHMGTSFRGMIFVFATLFTIMTAIYQFRFLYHPGAAALQLSMPIKRSQLWRYHWLSGWMLINFMVLYYTWFSFGTNDEMIIKGLLVGLFFENIVYAITVFFVSQCRRTMDAVLIGFGWLILAILLKTSFESFINNRSSFFIQAHDYSSIMTEDSYYYLLMISFPHLGSLLLNAVEMNFNLSIYYWLLAGWWMAIAIGATIISYWRFSKIKGESCGVYTYSYFVYPLMILVTALSLLNCIEWNEWTPFFYMLIFLIYAALYFVYKRALRFTAHMLIGFVLLTGFEVLTSTAFIYTHGFGMIQEVVPKEQFKEMTVELFLDQTFYIDEENQQLIKQMLAENHIKLEEGSILDMIVIRMNNESTLVDDVQDIQRELMEKTKQRGENYILSMMYWYYCNDARQRSFNYVGSQEEMNHYYRELFEALLNEDGQYTLEYYVTTIMEDPMIQSEEYQEESDADV